MQIATAHTPHDADTLPWLVRERVSYSEMSLIGKPAKEPLDVYSRTPLTIGMRGYSQLISSGMGIAIVSPPSRDKLWYFLEDIGHNEWGVDVQSPDLQEQLIAKIEFVERDFDLKQAHIRDSQKILWDITIPNVKEVETFLSR